MIDSDGDGDITLREFLTAERWVGRMRAEQRACLLARAGQQRADAFCASACAIFFYSGREFRDAEKLGYWDAPGFWWPVGGYRCN